MKKVFLPFIFSVLFLICTLNPISAFASQKNIKSPIIDIPIEETLSETIYFRYDDKGQVITDNPGSASIMRTIYHNAGWAKIDWTGGGVRWEVGSYAGGPIYFYGTVTVVDTNLSKRNKKAIQTVYVSKSGNRSVSGFVYPKTIVSHLYNAILNGTMQDSKGVSIVLPGCNASSLIRY